MVDTSKKTLPSSILGELSDIIVNITHLQNDVSDFDRLSKVMEQVGFLDETLNVATHRFDAISIHDASMEAYRQRVEQTVRESMPYNAAEHKSVAVYEGKVAIEIERRLKSTSRSGSTLLAAAVDTLKTNGVKFPGMLPKQYNSEQVDNSRGTDS